MMSAWSSATLTLGGDAYVNLSALPFVRARRPSAMTGCSVRRSVRKISRIPRMLSI